MAGTYSLCFWWLKILFETWRQLQNQDATLSKISLVCCWFYCPITTLTAFTVPHDRGFSLDG